MDIISDTVRAEIARQGRTQRELAQDAGLSPAWLSRLLNGHAEWSDEALGKVAEALGVEASRLRSGLVRLEGAEGAGGGDEQVELRERLAEEMSLREAAEARAEQAELTVRANLRLLQEAQEAQAESAHAVRLLRTQVEDLRKHAQMLRAQRDEALKKHDEALRVIRDLHRKVSDQRAMMGLGAGVATMFGLGALLAKDDEADG